MLNPIAFHESPLFFEKLDSAIASGIQVKIIFGAKLPDQDSDLWNRLGRCKDWSILIPFDYLKSHPEFMSPTGFAGAVNELVPLISNAIHFHQYSNYQIYTQQTNVGINRKILLRPLHRTVRA